MQLLWRIFQSRDACCVQLVLDTLFKSTFNWSNDGHSHYVRKCRRVAFRKTVTQFVQYTFNVITRKYDCTWSVFDET